MAARVPASETHHADTEPVSSTSDPVTFHILRFLR